MGDKCVATLKYKLNRKLDELVRRVNNKGYFVEVEEFRESIRFALKLSSSTEGFLAFLTARERLGLIDNVSVQKEFNAIVKQCDLILFNKDEILLQSIKDKNKKTSSYTWEEKVEILNRRESESRRTFKGAGYRASRDG